MKLASLAIILAMIASGAMAQPISIRPLSIKVVDAETRRPVPGITLRYRLCTSRPRYFLMFPMMDNPRYDDIGKRTAITNDDGIVTFERREYPMRRGEGPMYEEVMVNIGPVQPVDAKWDHPLFRFVPYRYLNDDYCGALVAASDQGPTRPNYVEDRKDIRYDVILVDNSLAKESEFVTVALARNPNSPARNQSQRN